MPLNLRQKTTTTARDAIVQRLASTPATALFAVVLSLASGAFIDHQKSGPASATAESLATHAPPPPYFERDAKFQSGEVTIAGTLTIPEGEGPFPALLIISGAGAQDRDSEFFGHPRGWVKADALARAGIAVLRTDDRGTGESTGDTPSATLADLAEDAWQAVRWLRAQPEVDPDRIGLAGSSQGSLVAPWVATEHPEVAFVVLLSAIGVPSRDLWIHQQLEIARATGMPETEVPEVAGIFQDILEALDTEIDEQVLIERLRRWVHRLDTLLPSAHFAPVAGSAEIRIAALLSPSMRDALQHDPRPALEQLRAPTLVIHGGKDLQVDPKINLAAIREALERAANPDFEIHLLPELNHFLQPAASGLPSEYSTIDVAIAPEVLERIAGWVVERFGQPAA